MTFVCEAEYVLTLVLEPGLAWYKFCVVRCAFDNKHMLQLSDGLTGAKVVISSLQSLAAEYSSEPRRDATTMLVQVRVGGYRLPKDLGIGQFRELKSHEVRRVTDKGAQLNPYL